MIERIIAALSPAVLSVSIIAGAPEYRRLGLPVLKDEREGFGPLEAIRISLARAHTPLVVLVGCDLPFVTTELFALLLSRATAYEAVVPLNSEGKPEPLCAVYPVSALPVVTEMCEAGERKVRSLFDRIKTRLVEFDGLRHLAGSKLFFENVNTPEEYDRAQQHLPRLNYK